MEHEIGISSGANRKPISETLGTNEKQIKDDLKLDLGDC